MESNDKFSSYPQCLLWFSTRLYINFVCPTNDWSFSSVVWITHWKYWSQYEAVLTSIMQTTDDKKLLIPKVEIVGIVISTNTQNDSKYRHTLAVWCYNINFETRSPNMHNGWHIKHETEHFNRSTKQIIINLSFETTRLKPPKCLKLMFESWAQIFL